MTSIQVKRQTTIWVGLTILFTLRSCITYGQLSTADIKSLDVILLIDNSRSTKRTDPESLRVCAARFLLGYLEDNLPSKGVTYRVGAANFGEKLGKTISLGQLPNPVVRDSLRVEQFHFTDFRPPLDFALTQFQVHSFGTDNRMAIFFFTDGNPRLPHKELSREEKKRYFMGDRVEGDKSKLRLDRLTQELQGLGAKLYIVAVGDDPEDAKWWRILIPTDHYHPINRMTNLAELYHNLFADLLEVGITLKKSEADSLPKVLVTPQNLWQSKRALWQAGLLLLLLAIGIAGAYMAREKQFASVYYQKKASSESDLKDWGFKEQKYKESIQQLEKENSRLQKELDVVEKGGGVDNDARQHIDDAEKRYEDAIKILKEGKEGSKEDAKDLLLEAMAKYVKYSGRIGFFVSYKISHILSIILDEIYEKEPTKQRDLICSLASVDAEEAQIRALARVLFKRWVLKPEKTFDEYYDLLAQPKGIEVLKAVQEMRSLPWDGENINTEYRDAVVRIISATTRFGQSMRDIA